MTSELKPDLSSFGYADGGYMSKCSHCKETFLGAKRAWSCKPCAIKKSLEPKIEQPKPHVPELVRYEFDRESGSSFWAADKSERAPNGEYVLHSQAVEIIAAKDKEIEKWKRVANYETDVAQSEIDGRKATEAKLAQYEAQVAAPSADLKAENERLREALRFYADTSKYPAPLTGGMGDLWSDCGEVAKNALKGERNV